MKKQELIHLHGLLAEVADHCADDESIDLAAYQSLGTSPTSIHQSKTAHKQAVFALTDGLTTALDDGATDGVASLPVNHRG